MVSVWDRAVESNTIWDEAHRRNAHLDRLFSGESNIEDFAPVPLKGIFDKELAAKASSGMYYSETYGVPPEEAFDLVNEFNFLHFGQEMPAATGWERIKQSYANGKAQVQAMDLGYQVTLDLLRNPKAYERSLEQLKKIEGQIKPDYWHQRRGLIERMLQSTADVAPFSLEALKASPGYAAAGGTLFGLGAIAAGQSGPQGLLPEEVISVPAATLKGMAAGAAFGGANRVRQLETGGMMLELMQMRDKYGNKIDPKVAVVASHMVGAVNGAIEVAEWTTLLSTFGVGTKVFENAAQKVTAKLLKEGTIRQIVAKKVAQYGATLSGEVLQEIWQEANNLIGGELAKAINNQMKGTDFQRVTGKEIADRFAEITTKSAEAFGLLVAPGTMISGVIEAVGQKKTTEAEAPELRTGEQLREAFKQEGLPTMQDLAAEINARHEQIQAEKEAGYKVSEEQMAEVRQRMAERKAKQGAAQPPIAPPPQAAAPSPESLTVEPEQVLNDLNPTGGIFTEYTPEERARLPIGEMLTTLDKTMNKPSDEMITIYRGAPKSQKEIVAGDFVTTNKQLAKDYAGSTGKVLEKRVKLSDILDDKGEPLGEDYIYRPSQQPSPVKESLTTEQGKVLGEQPDLVGEVSPIVGEQPAAQQAKPAAKEKGKGFRKGSTIMFDPEEWADMLLAAGYYMERGADTLAKLTDALVKEFGEDMQAGAKLIWDELNPPQKKQPEKKPAKKQPEKKPKKGLKKTSRAKRIEKRLNTDYGDEATYETMSMANQAVRADKMVTEEYDRAWRILRGQEEPPTGLRKLSLYIAAEIAATESGDVMALRELATGAPSKIATELGQEIKALDRPIGESPVKGMQEVEKARETAYTKRTGEKSSKKAKAQHVKEIKTKIKEQNTWARIDALIDSMEC